MGKFEATKDAVGIAKVGFGQGLTQGFEGKADRNLNLGLEL
jgi:hypothetical protein